MINLKIHDERQELYGDAVVVDVTINGHTMPFAFTVAQWQAIDQHSGIPRLPCGWLTSEKDVLLSG